MKLYAQHGAQAGEKVQEGLRRQYIDGVIFSPRDIARSTLEARLARIEQDYPRADRLLDPQYYTCLMAGADELRLGYLPEDYSDFFSSRRRSDFIGEQQIQEDIQRVLQFQANLPLTHLIAPNVLVSRSLDSREGSIAIDFLAAAQGCYEKLGVKVPMFLTLALSRDTLLDRTQLTDFVTEITGMGCTAAGFYLLVAAKTNEARTEVFHSDVVAGWMFLNYALRVNGFQVVNGYSDLLTPFLSAAGAEAGASGWWSNLRTFSLERFSPGPGGGKLPIQRYLSMSLLNRVTFAELNSLRGLLPRVLNGLPSDAFYDASKGSEPERVHEVLQSWEALRQLNERVGSGGVAAKLACCHRLIEEADVTYDEAQKYVRFDQKSNDEHLAAITDGLSSFEQIAELDLTAE